MNVIQNILTPEQQKEIKSIMESAQFPWYWNEKTVDYLTGSGDKSPGQLVHGFVSDGKISSAYFEKMKVIVFAFMEKTGIKVKTINRFKANLNTKTTLTQEELEAGYHRDLGEIEYDPGAESFYSKFVSLIYYVDDSDGGGQAPCTAAAGATTACTSINL